MSVPPRREGLGRFRSFRYGRLSATVEPMSGVLVAAAVVLARPILPHVMGLSSGAMIYVVVEELISEARRERSTHIATFGAMLGSAVMRILAVGLGWPAR